MVDSVSGKLAYSVVNGNGVWRPEAWTNNFFVPSLQTDRGSTPARGDYNKKPLLSCRLVYLSYKRSLLNSEQLFLRKEV